MIKKRSKLFLKTIIILVIIGISIFYITRSTSFQFFGEIYPNINTSQKIIALTFDDGPSSKTDTILSILKKHNVKATFYLNGDKIEQNFNETKKIIREGHEIGNHSFSHKRLIFKSYSHIQEQVERTDSLIKLAGYSKKIHFRPPYGKKFLVLPYYLKENNRKTIMWDIDPESFDDISSDSEKISNHVINNSENGSIILLHVMFRNESLESVDKIIKQLKLKGFKFKTISELLEHNNETKLITSR